jgi:hypothetical protein
MSCYVAATLNKIVKKTIEIELSRRKPLTLIKKLSGD